MELNNDRQPLHNRRVSGSSAARSRLGRAAASVLLASVLLLPFSLSASSGAAGSATLIPLWVTVSLGALVCFLVIFLLFILLLRKEVRAATQSITESEARYREIFEHSPVSLWFEDFSAVKKHMDMLRKEGITDFAAYLDTHPDLTRTLAGLVRVIDVNDATIRLHEAADKADLLGQLGLTFNEASFVGFRSQLLLLWNNERQADMDTMIRTLKGNDLDVALRWRAMPGSESNYERVLVMIYDITERKKMGEILQRTAKLDSLAVLAGGIAHDFNNLLGGIFGFIDMARSSSQDGSKTARYLDKSMQAFDRAKSLTQQLLTFSKGGKPIRKTASLAPLLKDCTAFALSGSSISSKLDIQEDLWLCAYDENQIAQVIDNIVINAKQAMPDGGTVCITAENYVAPLSAASPAIACRYVRVTVADTGIGIARDHLARIFDPFFTTKQKGYGLGLATCYSIMKNHDGYIDVDSQPGKGTQFTIYFPISPEQISASDTAGTTSVHRGTGRVLVMDDEEFNCEIVREMLKTMGYSVVEARDGAAAIESVKKAQEDGHPFTAVLLDLTIPGGMGGKDAVTEIRRLCPFVPVFASSGYSEDPVMAQPEQFGFTDRLPKPFRLPELAQVLNRHMQREHPAHQTSPRHF